MRKLLTFSALGLVASSGMAHAGFIDQMGRMRIAQANAGGASEPESLRIQQQTERQNGTGSSAATGAASSPTTEAPLGTSSSSIERNRIDTGGPARERVQIDEGASGGARGTGTSSAAAPNNTIIRGQPSTSGTATGTSSSTATGATGSSTGTSGASGSAGSASGGGGH